MVRVVVQNSSNVTGYVRLDVSSTLRKTGNSSEELLGTGSDSGIKDWALDLGMGRVERVHGRLDRGQPGPHDGR